MQPVVCASRQSPAAMSRRWIPAMTQTGLPPIVPPPVVTGGGVVVTTVQHRRTPPLQPWLIVPNLHCAVVKQLDERSK